MAAADMPPGPRAYHALVFAHARAGDAAGALAAIRREYAAGAECAVVDLHTFQQLFLDGMVALKDQHHVTLLL